MPVSKKVLRRVLPREVSDDVVAYGEWLLTADRGEGDAESRWENLRFFFEIIRLPHVVDPKNRIVHCEDATFSVKGSDVVVTASRTATAARSPRSR